MDGSGPEGDGSVNLNDVVVELLFNFDLVVQLVGNASDEFDNVVEVKKTKKQTKKKILHNEPRQYSQEKKLPNRSPTRLSILCYQ